MRALELLKHAALLTTSRFPLSRTCRTSTRATNSTLSTLSANQPSEVIVADPREILKVGRGASLQLRVPLTFLPQLSSPKFELGEADDPMSSYIFGKHKEIFEYNFVGTVSTRSGFVSLITEQALDDLEPSAVSWEALQASAEDKGGYLTGSKPDNPFLFIGQILEAAAVGVYTSHEGPDLDGVLITTSDDEISTP